MYLLTGKINSCTKLLAEALYGTAKGRQPNAQLWLELKTLDVPHASSNQVMTKRRAPKRIQWKKAKCTTVYAVCCAIFGGKKDEKIRLYSHIYLYTYTIPLEGAGETSKEVTNSGYRGQEEARLHEYILIFFEFWTTWIYYPLKRLNNNKWKVN